MLTSDTHSSLIVLQRRRARACFPEHVQSTRVSPDRIQISGLPPAWNGSSSIPAQTSSRIPAGGQAKEFNHYRIVQALPTDRVSRPTTYVGPGIQLPLLQTQPASGWAVAHFADASTGEKVMFC